MTLCSPSTIRKSKSLLTTALKTTSQYTSMIVFDIETNALKIKDITKIWCCAMNGGEETALYTDSAEWLSILENAELLIGHPCDTKDTSKL